jgi:N-acetylglutamate synthase
MAVDADIVASALAGTWEYVFQAVQDGWVRRQGGVVAGVTRVALPMLNGVWPESVEPDSGIVSELLDEVASSGLPYCLQLRPGASAGPRDVAAGRGMLPEEPVPLMLLEDPGAFGAFLDVDGLVVRELLPDEADAHATVVAGGFDLPVGLFRQFITPAVLALPGVRCYLGEVDGQPVATGIGIRVGPSVGVFDIATLPPQRGLGYGAAVTARVIADGLAAGARWSWLQSSAAGHRVYTRLGFRDIEPWDFWVMAV